MDKYIDEFCERHFSEFEDLAIPNPTDAFFNHPPMRPVCFLYGAFGVSIAFIVASLIVPWQVEFNSNLLKEIGLGLLTSSVVAYYFNLREESIRYYDKLVDLIECRMRSIDMARIEANEHIMNVSLFEGLQLLQFTVQNAMQFASYLNDKMNGPVALDITKDIIAKRDMADNMSDDEKWQHIQDARQTIGVVQKRLRYAKNCIRLYASNEKIGRSK